MKKCPYNVKDDPNAIEEFLKGNMKDKYEPQFCFCVYSECIMKTYNKRKNKQDVK